jgi:large subunit ribosomal protein L6
MRRPGDISLSLPKNVEVKKIVDRKVEVKGPKGVMLVELPAGISVNVTADRLIIERDEQVATKVLFGLARALLKNSIIGVTEGFEKQLTMIGVGYRAAVSGDKLDLQVGFSHPTQLQIPKNLQVAIDKGTTILIKGCDKHAVGQFAAEVRAKKPPEPYKGKGIRYKDELVRKKEGKAAKGKA